MCLAFVLSVWRFPCLGHLEKMWIVIHGIASYDSKSFLEKQRAKHSILHWFGEHILCHGAFPASMLRSVFLGAQKVYGPIQVDDVCSELWHQGSWNHLPYFTSVSLFLCLPKGPEVVSVHTQGMEGDLEVNFLSKLLAVARPKSETKVGREGHCDSWNVSAVKTCLTSGFCIWIIW